MRIPLPGGLQGDLLAEHPGHRRRGGGGHPLVDGLGHRFLGSVAAQAQDGRAHVQLTQIEIEERHHVRHVLGEEPVAPLAAPEGRFGPRLLGEELGVADGDRRLLGKATEHRDVAIREGPGGSIADVQEAQDPIVLADGDHDLALDAVGRARIVSSVIDPRIDGVPVRLEGLAGEKHHPARAAAGRDDRPAPVGSRSRDVPDHGALGSRVPERDPGHVAAAEIPGVVDHALEHSIHIKRRVDGLADLGQAFRLTPSLSRLLDELHVVQRQGRVVGESLHQSDLRVRELPHGPIGHGEGADDAATGLQRHRQ